MKRALQAVAAAGLLLTLFPSLLFFGGAVELAAVHSLMLWGMLLWFGSVLLLRDR